MIPKCVKNSRKIEFFVAATRKPFAVVMFALMVFPAAFATGAGKSNVHCQGTTISPTDDIVSIINNGKQNQTFCIEGEHRITSFIHVQSGQSLIGTTPNSRIVGAVVLSPWQPTSTRGVYYYDGPYARIQAHQQTQFSGGVNVCYLVTTYQDDLFFRPSHSKEQRVMRVLSRREVDPTRPVTTQGQAVTAGEAGRFFFDYANQRIYASLPNDQDPNTVTVDLAISLNGGSNEALIFGAGSNNVTLQNLWVEKGLNFGIFGASSWTLKDMTIQFVHDVGLYNFFGTASQPATIDDTLLTNNGRMALVASAAANVVITNSEMSWNNIANFRQTDGQPGSGVCNGYYDAGAFHLFHLVGNPSQPAVSINNLRSHHNIGDGLWADGGTQYTQITNSTFENNERFGYAHEASCQILFNGNTVYHNGYPLKNSGISGGGVDVSDSNYGTFSSNVLYANDGPSGNGFAFHLTMQTVHPQMNINKCLGARYSGDTTHSLKHNKVLANEIYACSAQTSIGKVWGVGGSLNSRGNQYQSNQYHLADSTSSWFVDEDNGQYLPQSWSTWRQGNHDSQGSMTVGCTHK
jgi:Right handed beta helix region